MVSSTPRPHFTPRKDPVPIVQEAGWAPGPVWTGGKSRSHRDSIPDRPARSQSLYGFFFSPLSARASGGPQLPRYRGFMITLKHNTLGRTTLDELSFRRRDLYLTIHNTHKRHTCTLPAGFEPVTPASKRPQTHALDCAGTASYYRC